MITNTPSYKLSQFLLRLFFLLAILPIAGIAIGMENKNPIAIYLGGLVGILLLILTIKYERFAFYFLIAILPLGSFWDTDLFASSLLVLPGGLAFFRLGVDLAFHRHRLKLYWPILAPALALGIWVFYSALVNGTPVADIRRYWLVIALLVLVPNVLRTSDDFRQFGWILTISLGLTGAYVLASRLLVFISSGGTMSATALHGQAMYIGDKNSVGMILSFALPINFYLLDYYRSDRSKRRWLWASSIFALLGLLATVSLGAFVGLCAIIFFIILLQDDLAGRVQKMLIAVCMLLLVAFSPLSERLADTDLTDVNNPTWGTYRRTIWEAAFKVFMENPLYGVGPNLNRVGQAVYNHTDALMTYKEQLGSYTIAPHNALLCIAVETGSIGLLFYALLVAIAFFSLWFAIRRIKKRPEQRFLFLFGKALFICMMAWFVQTMGINQHLGKYAWLFMGCAAAYVLTVNDVIKKQFRFSQSSVLKPLHSAEGEKA